MVRDVCAWRMILPFANVVAAVARAVWWRRPAYTKGQEVTVRQA